MARVAEKLGNNVCVVTDGKQAVEAIRNQKFDAVLTDVQMPNARDAGFKATELIHDMERTTATT